MQGRFKKNILGVTNMEELNSALHKFNQIVVEASRQASRDAITVCMTQVILPLLEKIGEMDARFKCTSPMPNEAYFGGMKATGVDEFELIVILTDLLSAKTFEDMGLQDKNLSCYGHVVAQQATHFLEDVIVRSGLSHDFISAERVRGIFARLISQAASILPLMGITLDIIYKGLLVLVMFYNFKLTNKFYSYLFLFWGVVVLLLFFMCVIVVVLT